MFGFLFKKRYKLDEPLTLLDQYFPEVSDKVMKRGPYWVSEDSGNYFEYYHADDADWKKEFSGLFDIPVHNFVEWIENDKYDNRIFAAGKIYRDKDERFINNILFNLSRDKVAVRDSRGQIIDSWYWYDDKIQMCLEKEYDNNPNHKYWVAKITYRLLEPTPNKWYLDEQKKKNKNKKKKQNGQDRIKSDVKRCLK
jgi:hypothetical protein